MKIQSAKAKGRRYQQQIRDDILETFNLEPDHVRSTSMGASDEDLLFSPTARKILPISVECKNQESLSVWKAFKQAQSNARKYWPVLFFKRNRSPSFAMIETEYFMLLHRLLHENEIEIPKKED